MKLKTLKDLPQIRPDENGAQVQVARLRQEAIKWVKKKGGVCREISFWDFCDFHNITKKDLQSK